MDWFTVEKIDAQTFAISEYGHWEKTHCYLLLGQEKAVLIDTGLGVSNIKKIVDSLTDLPVMVITTHVHWDHIGGHGLFSDIAVHEREVDWLACNFPLPIQEVKAQLIRYPCDFPQEFDVNSYQIFQGQPSKILHDGEVIDLGGRIVQVIHTPGHSPGHCCFYEPWRKYLYSGDLVYEGCLYASYPSTSPRQFYDSVKKIRGYKIERVLPGHYKLNISTALVDNIEAGFAQIAQSGQLKHGGGLFGFGDFQIQL